MEVENERPTMIFLSILDRKVEEVCPIWMIFLDIFFLANSYTVMHDYDDFIEGFNLLQTEMKTLHNPCKPNNFL